MRKERAVELWARVQTITQLSPRFRGHAFAYLRDALLPFHAQATTATLDTVFAGILNRTVLRRFSPPDTPACGQSLPTTNDVLTEGVFTPA